MRNLFLLALIGLSALFTGCGAVRNVADNLYRDTCVTSYNMFVCAETPSVPAISDDQPCVGTATRTSSASITMTTFGSVGTKQCKLLHRKLQSAASMAQPGTTCSIEGHGVDQKIVCAGLSGWAGILFLIFLITGRLFPRARIVCGVVALIIGAAISVGEAQAAITCQKAVRLIEAKEKAAPAVAIVLLEGCNLSTEGSVKDLWNRSTILESAAKTIVTSAERYCEDSSVRGVDVIECFAKITQLAKIAEKKSLKASNLWLAAKEKADAEKKAKAKARQEAEIKALIEGGEKQVEEAKELIEAMQGLKLEEGSCGGFILVLIYGLLGFLGGCRSKLLMVLIALGCMTSVADAAAKNGCSLDSDESIIELFEDSCSQQVLEKLIEEVGLVCTEEHRMEGASLSMAAPTEQGLSEEADLRLRFLEALCWKG